MIFSTVYVSLATSAWTTDTLSALLEQSRTRNAALGVTGLLVCREDVFMQVLEGSERSVRDLYRTIAADPRHHDVTNVWVADAPRRRFPDWSMGFRSLTEHPITLPGYRDLLTRPVDVGRLGRRDKITELLSHVAPAAMP